MDRKSQITKVLKEYDAATVKMLYSFVARVLLGNEDFQIVAHKEEQELYDIIQEDINQKIDFSLDSMMDENALDIFSRIEDYDYQSKKLKKEKCIELLSAALANETLFEGFCLAFYASDDILESICRDMGCEEQYQILCRNSVYQMRRQYMRMITNYTLASVHLYGVIHLMELLDIINEYEHIFHGFEKYNRVEGSYKNTIIFTPCYLCACTLQHLVGNAIPEVAVALDGLFLHECFNEEYRIETDEMMEILAEIKSQGREIDLDEVFSSLGYYTYRELFDRASEKPMYLPSKKEFLKYADIDYYEVSLAEKQFRRFLEKKHLASLAQYAKNTDTSVRASLDELMNNLHFEIIDFDRQVQFVDTNEFVENALDILCSFGIEPKNINEANEILGYIMNMANSTRLWYNHGYTPMELSKLNPYDLNNLTVVPGSSNAAKLLDESRDQLRQIGIHVDLDANATNVTMHSFETGRENDSQIITKKVYPNDPCPCGSGKKFKKCCGKK